MAWRRSEAGSSAVVPLFFAMLALPTEMSLEIFGANLYPLRLYALAMIPFALSKLASDPTVRLRSFDYAFMFYVFWLWLSIMVNHPLAKGIYFGGSLAVETVGAYLIARAYVRSYADFMRAIGAYFTTILVVAAFAVPESLLLRPFAHEIASWITGHPIVNNIDAFGTEAVRRRLGLMRAFSTFDHPILYGTFCAGATAMIYYAYYDHAQKWLRVAVIAFATFFSLSSGAYLVALLALAMCLWDRLTRHVPHRLAVTLLLLLFPYLLVSMASNRGAVQILIGMTLDPWTGLYRIALWEYGAAAVAQSPLFGITMGEWARPEWISASVDNFWLNMAMLGGVPVIVALLFIVASMMRWVHRRGPGIEQRERWRARMAWGVTIVVFCLQGITVHYWSQLYMLLFFLFGLGAWMADTDVGFAPRPASAGSNRMAKRTPPPARQRPMRPVKPSGSPA